MPMEVQAPPHYYSPLNMYYSYSYSYYYYYYYYYY
jgi:hypothetical protein